MWDNCSGPDVGLVSVFCRSGARESAVPVRGVYHVVTSKEIIDHFVLCKDV